VRRRIRLWWLRRQCLHLTLVRAGETFTCDWCGKKVRPELVIKG
jgi:hypothetical protein